MEVAEGVWDGEVIGDTARQSQTIQALEGGKSVFSMVTSIS